MGYKFFIKQVRGDGFYFGLYPNNNNRQPMGRSRYYLTYNETEEARHRFINEIKENGSTLFDTPKTINGKYEYECLSETGFHRVQKFCHKKSRDNCIENIIKNIDAPLLKSDKDDIKTF